VFYRKQSMGREAQLVGTQTGMIMSG